MKLIARAKVVATAAVTWINTAAFVVVVVADEIAKLLAPERAEAMARATVRILAVLTATVSIIRRVMPVVPDERGLLTPGN